MAVEQLRDHAVGEMLSIITGWELFHVVHILLIHCASSHSAQFFFSTCICFRNRNPSLLYGGKEEELRFHIGP